MTNAVWDQARGRVYNAEVEIYCAQKWKKVEVKGKAMEEKGKGSRTR